MNKDAFFHPLLGLYNGLGNINKLLNLHKGEIDIYLPTAESVEKTYKSIEALLDNFNKKYAEFDLSELRDEISDLYSCIINELNFIKIEN